MPTLKVSSGEFADFVVCFLLDKLTKPGQVIPVEVNEQFDDLSIVLSNKGLRSVLLQYYIQMNPQMRIKYKMIRKVFTDSPLENTSIIYIEKSQIPEQPTILGKTRKFLKKIISLGMGV